MMMRLVLLAALVTLARPVLAQQDANYVKPTSDLGVEFFYASKMDTPIANQGVGIHHPQFGNVLKERMDELGIECEVHTGIPRGEEWKKLTVDFV
jgi:hypothetical protein